MNESNFDPQEYWENRLSSSYNIGGVGRKSVSLSYNNWLYKVRKHTFVEVVNNISTSYKKPNVLDVGAGTGFYIDIWKDLGVSRVDGIDITKTSVQKLKKDYSESDFFNLNIGEPLNTKLNEPYDAISAMDVLFHIVEDEKFDQAIRNVHSLLSPGGFFIWSDCFVRSPIKMGKHVVYRSLKDIQQSLQEAGFSIVKRRPAFVIMSPPVDSDSVIRNGIWRIIRKMISGREWRGNIVGGLLYPIERTLLNILSSTPGKEIMVCKK